VFWVFLLGVCSFFSVSVYLLFFEKKVKIAKGFVADRCCWGYWLAGISCVEFWRFVLWNFLLAENLGGGGDGTRGELDRNWAAPMTMTAPPLDVCV
jgi:hypothetical protein